ncbi:M23 family metallopeptidase [Riemerella anatipestifer]|uniref:M23 family metallopeptidase n=1 Tax=Riemerella anatipestifer TaxID=34085 RepID=A0AAP6LK12_RIEAN|nr:M23 family metallopeptidase [Riemerella anatipestifer]MCO7354041.1 M23 family metallopeptidase [Riemerella anatipestifer]MCU7597582.1 M23 family metallopeptidase [Riemerella anatipestifer]MCW0494213.1 M23 family metallopeptidase [Riemerella anatipestifer]MCW0502274.1 M23 family metallopeptidase [Riemerella anatipestifer]MCW0508290.1 M23 family metallopeptidase [Riemerella anatipestifer]
MINKILTLKLFLLSIYVTAQFNTLIYNAPTVVEKEKMVLDSKIEKDKEEDKKEKKNEKKLFNFTTKSELKREIDSLKMMIKNINAEKKNDQNLEIKKSLQEAFIEVMKKGYNHSGSLQSVNSVKKYDYVEDYKPSIEISKIAMPVKGKFVVTSPFGMRNHPIEGRKKMHNGVDLRAYYENVHSVLDGVVTEVGYEAKGGNYIKIKHSDRFETAYLHLSEMYYKIGERVKAGFVIGKSGNSGRSTAPHLHFSVKEWGKHINPVKFLNELIFANNLISK